MNITKYEHACLVIEEQGQRLIIDPGGMTRDMGFVDGVVAVLFTHVHFDHFDDKQVASIAAHNPSAVFLGTDEVTAAAKTAQVMAVHDGETQTVGPFELRFFGEKHALVSGSRPDNQNVGVLVDGRLYYPGDSFNTPDVQPEVLALPVGGPWLKIGEAIELLQAVHPTKLCIPTHNGLFNEIGLKVAENWLPEPCQALGVTLKMLAPGESAEV